MIFTHVKFFIVFFFVWFRHLNATLCCSSSCVVQRCIVRRLVRRLIPRLVVVFLWVLILRSTTVNYRFNKWFGRRRSRSGITWIFSDLEFIILFVGILSLYAINFDVVSLFVVLPFMFLAMLNILLYLMCSQFELMNIVLFFCQK